MKLKSNEMKTNWTTGLQDYYDHDESTTKWEEMGSKNGKCTGMDWTDMTPNNKNKPNPSPRPRPKDQGEPNAKSSKNQVVLYL